MADAYTTLPGYSATPATEVVQKARAAASRAIELDPNLAEAHASLANIRMSFNKDFAGAEKEFQQAIELNPNYPTAHHWYALLLGNLGRFDEAKKEILRAQQLDPLSLIINRTVGNVFFWAREYGQALEQFKKTLEIDPNFPPVHEDLAVVYKMTGRYEEALQEMNKAIALNGRLPHYLATIACIHANSGHMLDLCTNSLGTSGSYLRERNRSHGSDRSSRGCHRLCEENWLLAMTLQFTFSSSARRAESDRGSTSVH